MIFYILLLFVILTLFFVSYTKSKAENFIAVMLLGVFILIGAFRDRIGWDYNNYVVWYIKGTRDLDFEFGYLTIMKIFRYLNLDFRFLFFFFSFFTYLFAYLGIRKYTKQSTLPLVLYFLIPVLYLYSFTYIRQCLSVSIAFYAFTFLVGKKKYFAYIFWMLIGISFHYSCLIPFLCFFVINKYGDYIKKKHLYILIVISFILSQIGIIHWLSLLFKDSHYYYYFSGKFASPVPLLKLLIINIMTFLIINYFSIIELQKNNRLYLLVVYVFSTIFLNLFSESTELTRIYIYFRIFEIILVADIVRNALKNKQFLFISFVCCFYLFPFFRAIIIDSESTIKDDYKLIPYKSLLLNNK